MQGLMAGTHTLTLNAWLDRDPIRPTWAKDKKDPIGPMWTGRFGLSVFFFLFSFLYNVFPVSECEQLRVMGTPCKRYVDVIWWT